MGQLELELWKEELLLQKDKNTIILKEIKHKIDGLNRRLNFILDIKEQLESSLVPNLEEEISILWNEHQKLQKENKDIETILFSIDIEIGNVLMCR
jgi:hypothetical protein